MGPEVFIQPAAQRYRLQLQRGTGFRHREVQGQVERGTGFRYREVQGQVERGIGFRYREVQGSCTERYRVSRQRGRGIRHIWYRVQEVHG